MLYNDITVVILLYKTPSKILKNLNSYKKFKVIILDQSNDKLIKDKVIKILPKIIYYKITKKNNGFAKSINYLSTKVKTKFFLCTQPDVKINLESILRLRRVFKKKKNCIISVPKIKSYENYNLKIQNDEIIKVKNMIGAIFLVKKDLFKKFKKFDENFFFYWEDVDISKRIQRSKYDIYLDRKSMASHLGGKSTKDDIKSKFIKDVNFKFGEYLYQFKYNELRIIKVFREPINNLFLAMLNLLTFQFNQSFKKLFYTIGILKFFYFLIKKPKLK